jgi:hypothetical protein
MLTLVIGLAVLLYGVTGTDQAVVKAPHIEVSASGLGGVIMVTSAIWAFFAYKTRPIYSRVREVEEKYDTDSQLLERNERENLTAATVGPARATVPRPVKAKKKEDVPHPDVQNREPS